ncbi:MAG TPA: hypoxanthine phosphoribosyltransferase [Acidobacteriota bacterium]|nr:hypoxanthine phosphoribosyltransferase [Acidobacteriota bacterium]
MLERTPAVGQILIDKTRIAERVRNLGGEISRDYQGKQPLVVGVLRGAVVFHADLIRHLELNLKVDFMSVASYGPATDSSGEVRLVKDLETSILGLDVILVEDIVDTGLTLDYLLRNLNTRRPSSLRVCSLLSKPDRRRVEVPIDYQGFEVPDQFVVGYGLDFNQQFRNLPHVALLNQDS